MPKKPSEISSKSIGIIVSCIILYNIKEREIDVDLNLIYPLSKVVIYNMDQIFALLDLIDYEHVNRIQFDGDTLWIPPN